MAKGTSLSNKKLTSLQSFHENLNFVLLFIQDLALKTSIYKAIKSISKI